MGKNEDLLFKQLHKCLHDRLFSGIINITKELNVSIISDDNDLKIDAFEKIESFLSLEEVITGSKKWNIEVSLMIDRFKQSIIDSKVNYVMFLNPKSNVPFLNDIIKEDISSRLIFGSTLWGSDEERFYVNFDCWYLLLDKDKQVIKSGGYE